MRRLSAAYAALLHFCEQESEFDSALLIYGGQALKAWDLVWVQSVATFECFVIFFWLLLGKLGADDCTWWGTICTCEKMQEREGEESRRQTGLFGRGRWDRERGKALVVPFRSDATAIAPRIWQKRTGELL